MRPKVANLADQAVAEIAGRQYGIATLTQLVAAGISSRGVYRRVQAGRLHRIHRGVYAVGHRALSSEGRWMAAVLACGEGAVLSHRSAAELWRLLAASHRWVDVTARQRGANEATRDSHSPLINAYYRLHHLAARYPGHDSREDHRGSQASGDAGRAPTGQKSSGIPRTGVGRWRAEGANSERAGA